MCMQQHSFIPGICTCTAVLTFSHFINTTVNKQHIVAWRSHGLRKAFDTICNAKLFEKVRILWCWWKRASIFRELFSRTWTASIVVINKCRCAFTGVICGVRGASVLGPIRFSLFVNDQPQALQSTKDLMYADDTALLSSGDSLLTLRDVISRQFAIMNGLEKTG